MDILTASARSQHMSRIRGKDTRPELMVRKLVHGLGYRFRLHRRDLPGSPDIVFPSRRKVIFIHGCFWHAHGCSKSHIPKTRRDFWAAKLDRNKLRDLSNMKRLVAAGWDVHIVWECELVLAENLANGLRAFLGPPGAHPQSNSPNPK